MSIQALHLTRPAISVSGVRSSLTRAGQVSCVARRLGGWWIDDGHPHHSDTVPFGVFALLIVIAFFLCLFPLETALLLLCLPFAAVFMTRRGMRESWIGRYPNSLREIPRRIAPIWGWIRDDHVQRPRDEW